MRRTVFDCMVFLQAAARPAGPAAACFDVVRAGGAKLFVSHPVLEEVRDVLSRPELRRRFASLTPAVVDAFLAEVKRVATVYEAVAELYVYDRDPKDSKYLNLTAAVDAEFLVSRDKDLLSLVSAGDAFAVGFRQRHPRLAIVNPVEFLNALRPAQ